VFDPRPSQTPGPVRLTRRELRIASLLATGASTDRVARDLFISPHTVAAHLGNMFRRVGASNRTELIARLYATGLLLQGAWPPAAINGRASGAALAADLAPQSPEGGSPRTAAFDALTALREAGHPVDLLPAGQRDVLAALDEHEVGILNSVRDRLEAVTAEVQGQDLKLL
jgi:DNA-binding CsgD family transcriptional regulator